MKSIHDSNIGNLHHAARIRSRTQKHRKRAVLGVVLATLKKGIPGLPASRTRKYWHRIDLNESRRGGCAIFALMYRHCGCGCEINSGVSGQPLQIHAADSVLFSTALSLTLSFLLSHPSCPGLLKPAKACCGTCSLADCSSIVRLLRRQTNTSLVSSVSWC